MQQVGPGLASCYGMLYDRPLLSLFVLAVPIACIAWTITHEGLFRELPEWLSWHSDHARSIWVRNRPLQRRENSRPNGSRLRAWFFWVSDRYGRLANAHEVVKRRRTSPPPRANPTHPTNPTE